MRLPPWSWIDALCSLVTEFVSLAGRLGIWLRGGGRKPQRSKPRQTTRLAFETLEPRPLLNGLSLYFDPDGNAANNNIETGAGLGGSGVWNTTSAYWFNPATESHVVWTFSPEAQAVFKGMAGTVTVASGTIADSLKFDASGYSLQSGSLELNGAGTIDVPAGQTVTISTPLTGSGQLIKLGAGTLVLSGNNDYSGGTKIEGGTLRLAHTSAAGAGLIEIGNGTLSLFRSGATTTYANPIKSLSGTIGMLVVDGSGTNAGTGTNSTYATGTITVDGTLTVARPTGGTGNTAFSAVLAGSGTLIAANSNGGVAPSTSALGRNYFTSTSNTFNGSVQVFNGGHFLNATFGPTYVSVDVASGGYWTLQGAGVTTTIGALTGAGSITKAIVADTAILAVGNGNASGTFSGVISQSLLSAQGTVALTKIGSGTQVLSGANTYSGATTVSAGTLQIGAGGTTGTLGTGAVVNNAELKFNRSNSLIVSNAVSGSGSVRQAGSGTLTFSANNSYSGGTTIETGTLRLTNVAGAGTGLIQIGNGTLSLFRGGATTTYANAIKSLTGTSGTLTVDGSGTNTSGTNSTYATGTITVDGTLTVARPTGGTGHTVFSAVLAGGGTLIAANSNGGVAPGASAIGRNYFTSTSNTFNGSVQVLNGGNFVNSTFGPTYVSVDVAAGGYWTLQGGGATTTIGALTGAGSITKAIVVDTAILAVGNNDASGNFSGVISETLLSALGTVKLTKIGSGKQTLSGQNNAMGVTTVSGGELHVTATGSIAGTAVEAGGILTGPTAWYQITLSSMIVGETAAASTGTLTPTANTLVVPAAAWLSDWRSVINANVSGSLTSPYHTGGFPGVYFRVDTVSVLKGVTGNSLASPPISLPDAQKLIVWEDWTDSDWDDDYWKVTATPVALSATPVQCSSCEEIAAAMAAGVSAGNLAGMLAGGIRAFDGFICVPTGTLYSGGFGTPFGQENYWTNQEPLSTGNTGSGMATAQTPKLFKIGDTTLVVALGSTSWWFDLVEGTYVPRFFHQDTLVHDSGNKAFVLTDTTGTEIRFNDFDASLPAYQRGTFKSITDNAGNVTEVTAYTAQGKIAEVQRTAPLGAGTVTESYLYQYNTSGPNAGLQSSVTLRRRIDAGAWEVVRREEFTYYSGLEAHGNAGDLKLSVVKDGAGATIDTAYMRYYVAGESGGYQHALKYIFKTNSFSRLSEAYSYPFLASDEQVAPYADGFLEFDAQHRVVTLVNQGEGCSACTGGLGTYTYEYFESENADGYNSWKYKTVETLPDGNQNIIYTNFAGQAILSIFKDATTNDEWLTFYKYDDAGRQILMANPSAVTGYDDTKADLLNSVEGNYQYLADASGILAVTTFYATTTATSSTAGGAAGYYESTALRHGELGDDVLQNTVDYIERTAGGVTIYMTASSTVYRNDDGTGAQTTSYDYTWFADTTQIESVQITLPVISAAQNGDDVADTETIVSDIYGRPIWTRDGDGFLTYFEYDMATGAVTKMIEDVDTTETGDFANLPSGWTTPAEGGLHLITEYEVDALGRTTKITDANGNVTFNVYNDVDHEVRTYRGWHYDDDLEAYVTTGPTIVIRENRANGYTEILTMAAAPNEAGGRPIGTEAVSALQTLTRSYVNAAGQVVHMDQYFDFTGMSYSTDPEIGTVNVNFYRTEYGYDQRGRLHRIKDAVGTITRTVYDSLGRVASKWVGTDDTPTTGFWSPENNAGANMVQITAYEYDQGGVGDSNLTRMTEMPDTSGDNDRVTDYFQDWRNRVVAAKAGVEDTESTDTNRPITYMVYDNLDQGVEILLFDGDGVTITNTDGVPNQPDAELLRAKTTRDFDDQGRIFRNTQSEVNQTDGTIDSETIENNVFYSHRGLVSQTDDALDRSTTFDHDGVGRLIATTLPDPDGAGAQSAPVYQTEYDRVGNVVAETDALGNITAYEYDRVYRLVSITQPDPDGAGALLSPMILYAYNAAGWLSLATDPLLRVTRYEHDRLGRVIVTTLPDPDGAGPQLAPEYASTYDGVGKVLTEEDTLGNFTTYSYDPTFQWLVQIARPDGAGPLTNPNIQYAYNNLGDMLSMTDQIDRVTSFDYNVLGQRVKITQPDPDGAGAQLAPWTVRTFDTHGAVLTSTDRLGHESASTFDGFHRLASSIDANGDTTLYGYDLAGNMVTLTDPVGNVTGWQYDDLDQTVIESITVDSVQLDREYEYDAVGNLRKKTDRDGRVTEYAFDNLYRRTAETWLDGLTVVHQFDFEYDAAGQMLFAGDTYADYSYDHDNLGRVTSISQDLAGLTSQVVFTQQFDAVGNRLQLAASIGGVDDFVNNYIYDDLYRMTRIMQHGQVDGNAVAEKRIDFAYDLANQRETMTRYADLAGTQVVVVSTYGHDGTGRLTGLSHDQGMNNLAAYAWAYDAANWVSQFVSATDGTSDYGYDDRGQLTDVDHDYQPDEGYTYDDNGNRTNAGYVTGDHNRLLSDGTFNYEYDAEGNRTKRTSIADGSYMIFQWDHRQRLASVTFFNNEDVQLFKVDYGYDYANRLVSRTLQMGTDPPITGHFVYDGLQMTLVFGNDGNLSNRLLNGPQTDEALADEVFATWDPNAEGNVYWLLGDNQQTIRDVASYDSALDETAIVNHRQFDSFGRLVDESNALLGVVPLAYTGTWRDPATGHEKHGDRWYDPPTGRWLSEDPIGFAAGEANLYPYVGNGPQNARDPSGLVPETSNTFPIVPSLGLTETSRLPQYIKELGDDDFWTRDRATSAILRSVQTKADLIAFAGLYERMPEVQSNLNIKYRMDFIMKKIVEERLSTIDDNLRSLSLKGEVMVPTPFSKEEDNRAIRAVATDIDAKLRVRVALSGSGFLFRSIMGVYSPSKDSADWRDPILTMQDLVISMKVAVEAGNAIVPPPEGFPRFCPTKMKISWTYEYQLNPPGFKLSLMYVLDGWSRDDVFFRKISGTSFIVQ